jgi:hypothetical protein
MPSITGTKRFMNNRHKKETLNKTFYKPPGHTIDLLGGGKVDIIKLTGFDMRKTSFGNKK